jgi:oligoribonuclease (3'-5' exoribonuclease)
MSIETILLLDTETTGLSPETDRIVEVGLVRWSVTQRWTRRLTPEAAAALPFPVVEIVA